MPPHPPRSRHPLPPTWARGSLRHERANGRGLPLGVGRVALSEASEGIAHGQDFRGSEFQGFGDCGFRERLGERGEADNEEAAADQGESGHRLAQPVEEAQGRRDRRTGQFGRWEVEAQVSDRSEARASTAASVMPSCWMCQRR